MYVLTAANIKGGVSKTNFVFQVSSILASRGFRVLCIDNDGQGNLTTAFLPKKVKPDLFDFLMEKVTFEEVVIQPYPDNELLKNIYLLPTTYDLYYFKEGLDEKLSTPMQLKRVLEKAKIEFDFVLIDTNPAISLTNDNAYIFSDFVIGISDLSMDSLDGLTYLQSVIDDINDLTDKNIEMLGIVLSKVDMRPNNHNKSMIEVFIKKHGNMLFNTLIALLSKNSESRSFSTPLITFDPTGDATKQFIQLTDEILDRIEKRVN